MRFASASSIGRPVKRQLWEERRRRAAQQKRQSEQRLVYGVWPSDRLYQHCSSGPKNSVEGWVSLAATTHSKGKRQKCVCAWKRAKCKGSGEEKGRERKQLKVLVKTRLLRIPAVGFTFLPFTIWLHGFTLDLVAHIHNWGTWPP